ncbi:protein of unknown function [Magnetospirillum gryphiswaldense MSR-1 v2]|uniref:Uncharacterized protein n=1 Tax=Magnetospirillum gryphiswaldense (strain DSM 6361 / JCM 21280 / NBRC 15271 / MSR-1) TaxID=431944 RepID=V6F675_MAGGM|nr:hypothetical protein [Magnetospirillum gryphiswaldense]CDK99786.1 protein of unknown function [Magnetospirillum gryphiswaldense MSR-1 v2]
MFLAALDEAQKDAFLALAANIAPPEDTGLVQWALWQEWLAEMGLPPRTCIGWDDAELAVGSFPTARDKMIVMLELARLSWEVEDSRLWQGMDRVATLLQCTSAEIDAVRGWAERLAALRAEAIALIAARAVA